MTSARHIGRTVAIADDPDLLRRLGQAIWASGQHPTLGSRATAIEIGAAIAICATSGDPAELADTRARLADGAALVAIVPPEPLESLGHAVRLLEHASHLIARGDRMDTLARITIEKLVSGDRFGLEKYLPAPSVELMRLYGYAERQSAVERLIEFAQASGARAAVRQAVAQAADELLMNALYDAPCDPTGRPLYNEMSGRERIGERSPEPVSLRFAAHGDLFGLSVRDRFGRLDKATLLTYLRKCTTQNGIIDDKTRGAGLGLYLVASSAAEVIVNVAPQMATEVICLFDLKARSPLRLISIFEGAA